MTSRYCTELFNYGKIYSKHKPGTQWRLWKHAVLVVTIFVRSTYNNQADFSYADYVTSSLRREWGGGKGGEGGVVGGRGGRRIQKVLLNRQKLREIVPLGLLTYGIKNFCWCQKFYGFDGPLNIENLPYLIFLKLTKTGEFYVVGGIFFPFFF